MYAWFSNPDFFITVVVFRKCFSRDLQIVCIRFACVHTCDSRCAFLGSLPIVVVDRECVWKKYHHHSDVLESDTSEWLVLLSRITCWSLSTAVILFRQGPPRDCCLPSHSRCSKTTFNTNPGERHLQISSRSTRLIKKSGLCIRSIEHAMILLMFGAWSGGRRFVFRELELSKIVACILGWERRIQRKREPEIVFGSNQVRFNPIWWQGPPIFSHVQSESSDTGS